MKVKNIDKYIVDDEEVERFEKFQRTKTFDDGTNNSSGHGRKQKSHRKEKVRLSSFD